MTGGAVSLAAVLGLLAGAALTVYGWLLAKQEGTMAGGTLTQLGALRAGMRAVVTGVASSSPFPTTSAMTGTPCLYYEHKLKTLQVDVYERRRLFGRTRFYGDAFPTTVHDWQIGGFFMEDPSGRAFVLPAGARTEFLQHEDQRGALGQTDDVEEERRIETGDRVTALGAPHKLSELIDDARRREGRAIEPGLLQALLALQAEGADFPCFFADGDEFVVSGLGYEDTLKRLEGSGTLYLSFGLLMLLAGVFLLAARVLGIA